MLTDSALVLETQTRKEQPLVALWTSIDQVHDDVAKALEADLVQTRKLMSEK